MRLLIVSLLLAILLAAAVLYREMLTPPELPALDESLLFVNTCDPQNQEIRDEVQRQQADEVLRLTNDARQNQGLSVLTFSATLTEAARWYSDDMKQHGYPTRRPGGEAHIGSDGSDLEERLRRVDYKFVAASENILMRENMDATGAFDMWWSSPPHKENMLANDVTEMGLAFTCNPESGEFYYTQVFGKPIVEISDESLKNGILTAINDLRRDNNLSELNLSNRLSEAAADESEHVVETGEFRSDVWDEVKETGYTYNEINVLSITGDSLAGMRARLSQQWSDDILKSGIDDVGIGVNRTEEGLYNVVIFLADPR